MSRHHHQRLLSLSKTRFKFAHKCGEKSTQTQVSNSHSFSIIPATTYMRKKADLSLQNSNLLCFVLQQSSSERLKACNKSIKKLWKFKNSLFSNYHNLKNLKPHILPNKMSVLRIHLHITINIFWQHAENNNTGGSKTSSAVLILPVMLGNSTN